MKLKEITIIFWVPEKKQLFIEEDILRNGNGNVNEKLFPLSLPSSRVASSPSK